ncbi:hypothetical protein KDU71_13195 [Carboxylicivirga sediminis]|uniref:Uncharacterized protein n=1 Tax=Carboxylicivirga sediminis TaxID=2006564 RepID=A0A941F467_9BACT|nr:DUF6261 family protein [Carboxylicivirga sediminis]MBR8536523.1 hypothetical protein [Carboxylicivirga sediminis]
MIKPILNNYLSSSEFYTLVKNIVTATNDSGIDETLKTVLTARINQNFDIFDQALNRQKVNPLTKEMEAIDFQRDELFMGLRTSAEALTYHWDASTKEAAYALVEIIRRNGWTMHRSGYAEQSAAFNTLLSEIKKEPATTYLATTNLGEWIARIDQCQQEFETVSTKREELDAKDKPLLTITRKQLYEDLLASLRYLESMAMFSPNTEITTLINTINEIISSVTSSARARKTRRDSEKVSE